MNYKYIVLAGLFLPIFGYTKENSNHLKELAEFQEQLYQKLLEMKELRKIISEGDDYLRRGVSMYTELYEQKTKESFQAIVDKNLLICTELMDALDGKQEFDRSLVYELFEMENTNFDSYKFIDISGLPERTLMMLTTMKYEKCLQELIKITKKIRALVRDLEKNKETL